MARRRPSFASRRANFVRSVVGEPSDVTGFARPSVGFAGRLASFVRSCLFASTGVGFARPSVGFAGRLASFVRCTPCFASTGVGFARPSVGFAGRLASFVRSCRASQARAWASLAHRWASPGGSRASFAHACASQARAWASLARSSASEVRSSASLGGSRALVADAPASHANARTTLAVDLLCKPTARRSRAHAVARLVQQWSDVEWLPDICASAPVALGDRTVGPIRAAPVCWSGRGIRVRSCADMAKKTKSGKAPKPRPRQQRRFEPRASAQPGLVYILGAVGAAAMGAGAWEQFGPLLSDAGPEPLKLGPYVLTAGAALAGVAIWMGTSGEPALRVGDGGLAVEKSGLRRMPWYRRRTHRMAGRGRSRDRQGRHRRRDERRRVAAQPGASGGLDRQGGARARARRRAGARKTRRCRRRAPTPGSRSRSIRRRSSADTARRAAR